MDAPYSPFTYESDDRLAAIKFVFQTRNQPDDTLLIRPESDSLGFTAIFTQNSIASRVVHHLSNTDLIPYIERVLTRFSFDEQCPDFVQIDCPGYSSVILNANWVQSYLSTLKEQIESLQNRWPREVVGKLKSKPEPEPEPEPTQASQPVHSAKPSRQASPPTLRVTRSSARRA
jgi:hypothetical protein